MRNSIVQKIVPNYDSNKNYWMSLYDSYNFCKTLRGFKTGMSPVKHREQVVSERFLRKDLMYRNRSDTNKSGIVIRKKTVPPEKW